MATIPKKVEYPTRDGKPMAETDDHRDVMFDLIAVLKDYYDHDPMNYVSGDLLLFYEEGNKRRHLAPDVFVVRGVPNHRRQNYLIWEEGKGPDLVIEVTSKSTRREDERTKRDLYRDVLRVPEYILFDPLAEYLKPPLQGYRLVEGDYRPIEPVEGRLPSEVLGLHFERAGVSLRLFSPSLGRWLPTASERIAEAVADTRRAYEDGMVAIEDLRRGFEAAREEDKAARVATEEELARLRREVEALRRASPGGDRPE